MDPLAILRSKIDGHELTAAESEAFLASYVAEETPDYVASALLAAIFAGGMGEAELEHWTRAMVRSGEELGFPDRSVPLVDKHSTGGVGDKVSIALAPALAACGVRVPMISGRGLGHTGGTLDKLEAIPGFSTRLSLAEVRRTVEEIGAVITGQTADLVPADAKLYALRDATGLVDSLPLIASSIVSKKVAEGIDALVLDVKFGSGAFLGDPEQGAQLARVMIDLAARLGLRAIAFQTAMDRPLGRSFGNALELAEAIECASGGGPADLRELVCALGGALLAAAEVSPDSAAGEARIASALDDGSALARLAAMVEAQGGDPRYVTGEAALERAPDVEEVRATQPGRLLYADVRAVGRAVVALGGGRHSLTDEIDHAVGIVSLLGAGERFAAGDVLFEIHHRHGRGLEDARRHLQTALLAPDEAEKAELAPLILARIDD